MRAVLAPTDQRSTRAPSATATGGFVPDWRVSYGETASPLGNPFITTRTTTGASGYVMVVWPYLRMHR